MTPKLKEVVLDVDAPIPNRKAEALEWLKAYKQQKEEELCQKDKELPAKAAIPSS